MVIIPIYIFYWKGEWFRERSKFAQQLNLGRKDAVERRRSSAVAGRNARAVGGGEKETQGVRQTSTAGAVGVRHVEQV